MDDKLVDEHWDTLVLEEREKLKWRQRFNIFKQVFFERDIILSENDFNTYKFLNDNLTETKTPKTDEINGYKYKDKKIIKRKKDKTFSFIQDSPLVPEFLTEFNNISTSANSVISQNIEFFTDIETNKKIAEEYIENLRKEQIDSIMKSDEGGEYFEMKEFNDINDEIEQVKENKNFKIRGKVWKKSLGGFLQKLGRNALAFFKTHKFQIANLLYTITGIVLSILGIKTLLHYMGSMGKHATKQIEKLKNYLVDKLSELQGSQYFVHFLASITAVFTAIFKKSIWSGIQGLNYLVRLFFSFGYYTIIPIAGGGYYFLDKIKYYGLKAIELSYLLSGQNPPKENTEQIVKIVNEKLEDYIKNNLGPKNQYNSTIAKASSYIVGGAGKIMEKTSEGGEALIDKFSYYLKYIIGLMLVYFIINIIIKWKT